MIKPELQLNLLGAPQVFLNTDPVTGFVSKKAQALLFYLAETQQPHTRQLLAALLWPEMPETTARTNLRKALSNLRRLFPEHLLISRHTAAFNPDSPYCLDSRQFEHQLDCLQIKNRLNSANYEDLTAALELYRGDFLAGFSAAALPFEEWMLARRGQLHELAVQGLLALADNRLAARQFAAAVDLLRRLLALDPWREEAHRKLMLALARNSQRSAALAQYRDCRRILADELDAPPLPETTALYDRIRALPADPAARLPALPTPFVGRQKELDDAVRLLNAPDCRLLTLAGLGGVGKTRLALKTAETIAHRFLDGAYFVPLANASGGLPAALAHTFQLPFQEQGDPREQLLSYLGGRECLLLLDNFESCLSQAPLLHAVLTRAPNVKLLVTSRERTNLPGEWVLQLHGLDYPAKPRAGDDLELYSATALFLQRARQSRPNFQPNAAERQAIIRIARLLGGLPLGMELAAGWVQSLSCSEICDEISGNLNFLSTSAPGLPERHRSMRAALLHSWRRLSADEQRLFARLALFSGTFSRQAAAEVAGIEAGTLKMLVDKSLVRALDGGRYTLHELWRQFLQAELARRPAGRDQTAARHSHYFQSVLARYQAIPTDSTCSAVSAEFENIWAGWQWAARQQNAETAQTYVAGLSRFLEENYRFPELIELLQSTLEPPPDFQPAPPHTGNRTLQQTAAQYRLLAEAHYQMGHLTKSEACFARALSQLNRPMPAGLPKLTAGLAVELGRQILRRLRVARPAVARNPARAAAMTEAVRAFERLGQIYFFADRTPPAIYAALKGLNLAENIPTSPELVRLYANMELAMGLVPFHPLARLYARLAADTAARLNHPQSLAWALEVHSLYSLGLGHWAEVRQAGGQAINISRKLGHHRRTEECQVMLAEQAFHRGRFSEALTVWQEMYYSALQRGDVQVQKWSLSGQAQNLLPQGHPRAAISLLEQALALPVEEFDRTIDISCLGGLAVARLQTGHLAGALDAARQGLELITDRPSTTVTALDGYAGIAETLVRLAQSEGGAAPPDLLADAQTALEFLRRFSRLFPTGKPYLALWHGKLVQLEDKQKNRHTQKIWRDGVRVARSLEMLPIAGRLQTELESVE